MNEDKQLKSYFYYKNLVQKGSSIPETVSLKKNQKETSLELIQQKTDYYFKLKVELCLGDVEELPTRKGTWFNEDSRYGLPIYLTSDYELSDYVLEKILQMPVFEFKSKTENTGSFKDYFKIGSSYCFFLKIHITNPIQNADVKGVINRSISAVLKEGILIENELLDLSQYLDFETLNHFYYYLKVKNYLISNPLREDYLHRDSLLSFYVKKDEYLKLSYDYVREPLELLELVKILNNNKKEV